MEAKTKPAEEPAYVRSLGRAAALLRLVGVLVGVPSVVLVFTVVGTGLGLLGLLDAWAEMRAARDILRLRRSGRNLALAVSSAWLLIALWYIGSSDDSVLLLFVILIRVPIVYPLVRYWKEFE